MLFLLSSLDFSLYFSPFIFPNGASVHTLPWVPEVVSRVRLGTSFCRPKAEDTSSEAFREGHFLKTDWNRKPRMKSLWHPGYSHIRTVTIFGVIRMGVYTTPDIFGAGTETVPEYGFCEHITTVISVWFLYCSLYTDVVLFFFSFFSKTVACARKKNIPFSLTPNPLRWRGQ